MARALSDRTVAGTAVDVRRAVGLRHRPGRPARRQFGPLTYTDNADQHPAHRDAGAGRRSGRAAARRHRDHRSERQGHRPRFLRRPGVDREPARAPRSAQPALQFSNPAGTTLRILDDGAANTVDVDAVSATNTVDRADRRQRRAAVLPRRQRALYRRDHLDRRRRASASPAASRSMPVSLADPSQARGVPDLAADARRRRHAAELHLRPAHQRHAHVLAAFRHRHRGRAVQRLAAGVHAPGDQPAGRGGAKPPPT